MDSPLEEGRWYRLRTQVGTQRYERESVLQYLGMDGYDMLFNARPLAGTQRLSPASLVSTEALVGPQRPVINRIVR